MEMEDGTVAIAVEVEKGGERRDEEALAVIKQRITKRRDRRDCTEIVNEALSDIQKHPKTKQERIDILIGLEKTCRQGQDGPSTARVLIEIIQLFADSGDWRGFQEYSKLMSKRRGLIPSSVQKMMEKAVEISNGIAEMEDKLAVQKCLLDITEGKIYLEVERAALTMTIARHLEAEGKIDEAAEMLQEVAVETFGAMTQREKLLFILEQIRVVLLKGDYYRTKIIANKISARVLSQEEYKDIAVRYHGLMMGYYIHEGDILRVAKGYLAIFNVLPVELEMDHGLPESLTSKVACLTKLCAFIQLAKRDPEQHDLLLRLKREKLLYEVPEMNRAMGLRVIEEVINAEDRVFLQNYIEAVVDGDIEDVKALMDRRISEHNLYVIAAYYEQISLSRLSVLVGQQVDVVEDILCDLIANDDMWARVDRLEGVVCFQRAKTASEALNEWQHNITSLLGKLEQTSHLIQRELSS